MAQNKVQDDPRAIKTSAPVDNKKQPTMQEKKAALREIPDNPKPSETQTQTPIRSKDKSDSEKNKTLGTKRSNPSSPASPLTYTYVRRKLDSSPAVVKEEVVKEKTAQNVNKNEGVNGVCDRQNVNRIKVEASEVSKPVDGILMGGQDWKERFVRLQAFLKNCDQSNQEDYMRMLRSLTAVGRSKHAIELEKRAIHLLLEEGKELHKMKALNVLGKGPPTDPVLYLPQLSSPAPSRAQLQR